MRAWAYAVLALAGTACGTGDDGSGPSSTSGATTVASTSTDESAADTDACGGSCFAELQAFLALADAPPPLCGEELVAWSNLELCLIDCDTRVPAPDDEGFCACTLQECAPLLDACGPDAAALCVPPGATSSG